MVVPAGPSRDRHEAATWLLRWPGAFSRVLGGRASRRRSAKHVGKDRAEPTSGAIAQRVLAIRNKRCARKPVDFLTQAESEAVLAAPNQATWSGRRDRTLML